jgi:hypothetical protein
VKYSQAQALTALAYCRELIEELERWAHAFACEEPEAAQRSFETAGRVRAFLKRMEQEAE